MNSAGDKLSAPQRLAHSLAQEIENAAPGAALPSVRALQKRYRSSPVTITRALSLLRDRGLISVRPGHGAFVAPAMPERRPGGVSWQSLTLGARDANHLDDHMTPLSPDEICLNGGYLSPDLQPLQALRRLAAAAAARESAWDQIPVEGLADLRAWFAGDVGSGYRPHDVIVAQGGQSALSTVFRAIGRPGTPILVESPTYVGALAAARAAGLVATPIPVDAAGVRPDDLASAFAASGANLFYCQPLHANPSGATLAPSRRSAVLRAAEAANAFIVEDDSTRHLHFGEGAAPPPLAGLDPDRVVLIRSLTKPTCPSLRIAAILSKGPVRERIRSLRVTDDMFVGGLLQEMALALVTSAAWPRHLAALRRALRDKRDLALRAAERAFGKEIDISRPEGGLHLWLRLPEGSDERGLVAAAARAHVHVSPGTHWHAAEPPAPQLRLSYGGARAAEIEKGIAILGDLLRERSHAAARPA